MENANIVIFEDHASLSETLCRLLEFHGHVVTARAQRLDTALATVENIAAGNVECDVVILDGNLEDSYGATGDDAREIVHHIRIHQLGARIIGFSGFPMEDYGLQNEVDSDPQKDGITRIPGIIRGF